MDTSLLISYLPALGTSLLVTLKLLFAALSCGLLLAILLTVAGLSEHPWLYWPVQAYIFIIRGTPLLIQIFLIYYGSSQFSILHNTAMWDILKQPFACAILAFSLNSAAYTAVLLMGAVRSIPQGERDACEALGMSRLQMLQHILLPRAIRIALPNYSNEVIMMFQNTSLASTITLLDLLGMTQQIISETYASVPFFLVAAVIYFIFNSLFTILFHWLERQYPAVPRHLTRAAV